MYQIFLSFSLEIIYFLNCAARMVEWLQQFELVRAMAAGLPFCAVHAVCQACLTSTISLTRPPVEHFR